MKEKQSRHYFLQSILWGWLLLLATGLHAQEQVSLSGRVLDEEQTPLAFVTVKVEGQLAGGTTDLDGKYKFTFQTADTVVITYQMMGFQKRTKKLVRPQGKLTLNIVMKPVSLNLEGVTVKEVRRQLGTTQQLDAAKLKQLPSTTGNAVEELVATQAGVSTHNELSSQYNVRGGSFDENSVYINGVEVYRPLLISSGQQEGLSVINSDMVEKIENGLAASKRGFAYLHVFTPCPTGWSFPPDQTIEVSKLAVKSNMFPLWECSGGKYTLNYQNPEPMPVSEFVKGIGKFKKLSAEQLASVQHAADERYAVVSALAAI